MSSEKIKKLKNILARFWRILGDVCYNVHIGNGQWTKAGKNGVVPALQDREWE